ncbi:MAG: CotH kinase family protein, partial [Bacteroidetes bacterium]|nr:CotH kinase family protein [Bacteroidota bacterium]
RCIMYVNGKYWGIYTIREKVDDPDFMKYYYGQNKYNIEFLMIWGNTWIEYGGSQTLNEWRDFQNFIVTNDMSDPETYQTVVDKFDFKSLIDYVLINEYVVCSDWLNWNTGWWRGLDSTGLHQKWGYILWDDDATFGHYINYSWVPDRSPYGDPCFAEGMWQADTEGHIDILNKLRENSEFEQYYISRYIDLYNTAFSCDFVISLLDSLAEVIRPEMTQHTDKWGGSLMEWEDNITKLRTFVTERCEFYPSGLNDCYTLTGPYPFLVSTDPVDVGEIQLNSLRLKEFPFEGSYFSGVDIKLEIFNTDSTYVFDHWKSTHTPTPNSSSKSIVLNIDTIVLNINRGDTVTAVFKKIKIIENFDLSARAYPNPFDGSTKLVYTVPEVMDVSINIYNILGQNIDFLSLDKKTHQPGRYELDINADDLGMLRGIYFVKFRAGDFSKVIKIMRN